MARADKLFYVVSGAFGIVFGTGLWAIIIDRNLWVGVPVSVFGVAGMAGSLYETGTLKAARLPFGYAVFVTLMSLAAMFVSGYDLYDRHYHGNPLACPGCTAWDDNAPLERIYSEKFENQTVPLDGFHYINPVFDNVTFDYEGVGQSQMDSATFVKRTGGIVRFRSQNKVVGQTVAIIARFAEASGCHINLTYSKPDKTWTVMAPQPK